MTDKSIYPNTFAHAMAHSELDAFRESMAQNNACAAAIDKAIAESRREEHFYTLPAALDTVRKEFGLDRVTWVVASTIQHHDYDGRYTRTNKAWAQNFPIPRDRESGIFLNSHPVLLDGFATTVQRARIFELAQTVGAYEKSHRIVEHNRLTLSADDLGGFAAKPDATDRRLSERCAEIAEKQSVLAQPTVHAGEPAEMVHGYKILEATLFVNNRGFALAENLGAPSSYVTWQFTEERGNRDYYWGHYMSDADRARQDYHARVEDYRDSYHLAEKNPIAAVEMSTEQNYNQIDGLRNNMAPSRPDLTDGQTIEELRELAPETLSKEKPSVLGQLREARESVPREQGEHHAPAKHKEDLSR